MRKFCEFENITFHQYFKVDIFVKILLIKAKTKKKALKRKKNIPPPKKGKRELFIL